LVDVPLAHVGLQPNKSIHPVEYRCPYRHNQAIVRDLDAPSERLLHPRVEKREWPLWQVGRELLKRKCRGCTPLILPYEERGLPALEAGAGIGRLRLRHAVVEQYRRIKRSFRALELLGAVKYATAPRK